MEKGPSGLNSEAFFFDADGKSVDSPDKAVTVIIRETDDDGNLVRETFGTLN